MTSNKIANAQGTDRGDKKWECNGCVNSSPCHFTTDLDEEPHHCPIDSAFGVWRRLT